MKEILLTVGTVLTIIVLELCALAIAAGLMTITTFVAWDVVLHPVLGLPALTVSQIFVCAWAFLFCIATAEQAKHYFSLVEYVDETTVEKVEGEDDNDKES